MDTEGSITRVKNMFTGKGEITSQNHGFVMDRKQVDANDQIEISHIHLNDQTVLGIRIKNKKCFLYSTILKPIQDLTTLLIYLTSLLIW